MYDIIVIGAGVTGTCIARELSKYQVNMCVIEKGDDVASGTSKANSAIIHGGFDATPGTLKAKLNVRGNFLMDELARELDIPFKRNGSLVVCTKDQDRSGLEKLLEKGTANGVPDLRIVEREELIAMEPNLSDGCHLCTLRSYRWNRLPIPYDDGICRECLHKRSKILSEYTGECNRKNWRFLPSLYSSHRYEK